MPQFALKSNIISTQITVPKELDDYFLHWQAELNDAIAKFPGFLSLEILSPEALKISAWSLVQRFSDPESASVWYDSLERKKLLEALGAQSCELKIEEIESSNKAGVTEVIITQVSPEKREAYKAWIAKMHLAESKFPGFRGMYVQSPGDKLGHHWITLLEFDTVENLDRWLTSKTRKEILKELDPMITSVESHRIISPFAGWFSSIAKIGEIPSIWKQTMLVLLVLFPIVMLELKFLSPLTAKWDLSFATILGNAISVTLIAWPMMPFVAKCFKFWLVPDLRERRKNTIYGTLIVSILYLIEILLF